MNNPRGLLYLLVLLFTTLSHAADQPRTAILLLVSGNTTLKEPGVDSRRPGKLFDRLAPGAVLSTGADGNITLAFLSGKRFQLLPNSEAEVMQNELKVLRGSAKPLADVPNSVSLAPILAGSDSDQTGATVRLRKVTADEYIESLYPRDRASLFAKSAVLRFQPIPGITRYEAIIEGPRGEIVYKVTTESGEIAVPDGVLQPGGQYHWTVESAEGSEVFAWGGGSFQVLSIDQEKTRTELQAYASRAQDSAAWALLIGMDMNLGLWWEARDDLNAALELASENTELLALRQEIEKYTRLKK